MPSSGSTIQTRSVGEARGVVGCLLGEHRVTGAVDGERAGEQRLCEGVAGVPQVAILEQPGVARLQQQGPGGLGESDREFNVGCDRGRDRGAHHSHDDKRHRLSCQEAMPL